MNMNNFETFSRIIMATTKVYGLDTFVEEVELPGCTAKVTVLSCRRKDGNKVSFNMEKAFQVVSDCPESINGLMKDIVTNFQKFVKAQIPGKEILNWEFIQKRLTLKVAEERNVSKEVPCVQIGDTGYVIYAAAYIDELRNEEQYATINITNSMLSAYKVSLWTLLGQAAANDVAQIEVQPMEQYLTDFFPEEVLPLPQDCTMVVVTNKTHYLGAASLFLPGVAEKLAEMTGGAFYALPSSIHEFLVVPKGPEAETLQLMVQEVNKQQVEPAGEKLSDTVLLYEDGRFKKV